MQKTTTKRLDKRCNLSNLGAILFGFAGLVFVGPSFLCGAEAIKIKILEGEGALNNIQARRAKEPVVRVETENGTPVVGAVVHFRTPTVGASGLFADGTVNTATVTDAEGRAGAPSFRPNHIAGQFQIQVTASYQGQTDSSRITQTNAEAPTAAKSSSRKITILAILGAAVAGATLASRGGGKDPARPPSAGGTTISLGNPSLGAP